MRNTIFLIGFAFCLTACEDIVGVTDISKENITILAPVEGVTVTDAKVTFNWEALDEVTHYNIQIATPAFKTATQIITDSTLALTSFSKALTSGNYEWRVRAENSGYKTSYTTQKFIIATNTVDISNKVLVITSPNNNATFTTTDTITIEWEAIEGAEEYQIQIVTPDFDNPTKTINDETITSTNLSISNLEKNTYKCRVKAKNVGFETGYTDISFTVN